ncbi:unnamed protein product, partial [Closterium sp. NIES-54]
VAPPAPPHGGPLPLPRVLHARPALLLGALVPLLVGGAAHMHAHGGAGVGRSARVLCVHILSTSCVVSLHTLLLLLLVALLRPLALNGKLWWCDASRSAALAYPLAKV